METKFVLSEKNLNIKIDKKLKKIYIPNINYDFYGVNYKKWENNKELFFKFGFISGIRNSKGFLEPFRSIKKNLKILQDPQNVSKFEGRFIIFKFSKISKEISIWCDNLSRSDVYYSKKKNIKLISSNLEVFTNNYDLKLDKNALAHSMIIYGGRPPKMHTIYQKISRISKDQIILIKKEIIIKQKIFFLKNSKENFNKNDLENYGKHFLNTIKTRSSDKLNIVLLSSGWDSTSILAALHHLKGSKKIIAVIGRMKYAKRSGVINSFEILRAKKIAEFYKVKLDIYDWNYSKQVNFFDTEFRNYLKNNQFFSWTAYNHWNLLKYIKKKYGPGIKIFAGEISDGAHNLGFSQYVTIFHPGSYDFREYSDKMNSYLFGPTFLRVIFSKKLNLDPVWKIFKSIYKNSIFEKIGQNNKIISQILSNFFLRPARIPFYSIDNSSVLLKKGKNNYLNEMEKIYLKDISKKTNPNNLYSTYIHLYNYFHWQGSTVNTLENISDYFGLKCEMPFLDSKILEILSIMPEKYGRGLDFKNTKYPLKWFLKNKINYPYELQSGPHSYTYDVNPTFTHPAEVLYGSAFKKEFKKILKNKKFLKILDQEHFNKKYINRIINQYINNKELKGNDMINLFSISLHSTILP